VFRVSHDAEDPNPTEQLHWRYWADSINADLVFDGTLTLDTTNFTGVYITHGIHDDANDIYLFGTDGSASLSAQLWGSWDGKHWVLLWNQLSASIWDISQRKSGNSYYFTDRTNGKLYRLSITKEDLIRIFYGKFLNHRGSETNAENFVLEQRIYNGTEYIDLTDVALTNVQASIKGLSANNTWLNTGFETGDISSWTINSGFGTYGTREVTNTDKHSGSYSLKVEKNSGDSYTMIGKAWIDSSLLYLDLKEGDIIVVSAWIKANVSLTDKFGIQINKGGTGKISSSYLYFDVGTSWKKVRQAWIVKEDDTQYNVHLYFEKGTTYTMYMDDVQIEVQKVHYAFMEGQDDSIQYIRWQPSTYQDNVASYIPLNTTNPTLTVNSETVSHSGELANGTESTPTSLSGILTGAVQVSANIQGSGQAILKLNGTRILYEDSTIIEGRANGVYYGRYYGTFSPTTSSNDPIVVTNLTASLSSISLTSTQLRFTVDSPASTTSVTQIYVGNREEPDEVSGADSYSYDSGTQILTVTVSHSSPITITVKWKFACMHGNVYGEEISLPSGIVPYSVDVDSSARIYLGGNVYGEEISLPSGIVPYSVDVDSSARIYLGANKTVWRSDDRGESWIQIRTSTVNHDGIYVSDAGTVFLVYASNIYYSTNQGSTWNAGSGWVAAGRVWHWDEDSNAYIYTHNYNVPNNDYIYRSTDGGASWSAWYNVSATSNPVRHIHSVKVAPNDYVFVMTGDQDVAEADDNTIRRYNGTGWETLVTSNSFTDAEMRWTDCFFMDEYVYGGPDLSNYMYRLDYDEANATWWSNRQKILKTDGFSDNEVYDSIVIDGVGVFASTDSGDIVASWDGLHWVKVFEQTTGLILRLSSRESFPIYFVDLENSKLYRLNEMTKEDLIQLFYKTYNVGKGSVTNEQNFVLEQRIYNGTEYLDLTSVALSNVDASIIGLSKSNELANSGFETGDMSNWTESLYGGVIDVVSDEKYEGTYSCRVNKTLSDLGRTAIWQQGITVGKGDVIITRWAWKANDTLSATGVETTNPMTLVFYNVTGSAYPKLVSYSSTTSWSAYEYVYIPNSQSTWDLRVQFSFGKQDLTSWFDASINLIPEVAFQGGSGDENIAYNPEFFNSSYFTGAINTTNPTITINGETVSHTGQLANGTESSTTSLTGILTGAVKVDAVIGGSGQAILKITGTRVLYADSIILKGRTSGVYYGRYYSTLSLTTNTTDLIALTNLQANITSLSLDESKLTLIVDSPSGTTSTTKVYCGDKGEPTNVLGATTWTYNSTDKILTTTATHSSFIIVTVKWKFPGDVNGDGIVNILDLSRLGKAFGATPTDLNWDKEADINSDNIVDVLDLSILGKNYGKTS